MQLVPLGKTGLQITRLGVGLAEIGNLDLSEAPQAGTVLNTALDAGINFLDTAACYGNSEELIGLTVPHRRSEYILATKCGHVAGDYNGEPWTSQTIIHSIERSLRYMKTDYLDLIQLHSCDLEVLKQGEVIQTLQDAKDAGKTRFIGYSGDNEHAEWAVNSGVFDTLQTSFSLVDQRARHGLLQAAEAKGMGIIIKRPIGNGVWGAARSNRPYTDEYFNRAQLMQEEGELPELSQNDIYLAMAFVFSHNEVSTAIVGTSNPVHMRSNIDLVEGNLHLPEETRAELYRRFDKLGGNWTQQI